MRNIFIVMACSLLLMGCKTTSEIASKSTDKNANKENWKLVFEDQFNTNGNFDEKKWGFSTRGNSAWAKYLTSSPEYAYQDKGNLILTMNNKVIKGDDIPYHSGGIQTKGKFSFLYGKVEARAKFNGGRGSWPAIWMMPETSTYGNWPNSGEIDIMEHVNNEDVVHQTIHNGAVTTANGGSSATKTTNYIKDDYNIYGIVWSPTAIEFYVNNKLQYTYNRKEGADSKSWPFDKPFYLILNQSGGLGWPGPITDADLPFHMNVDWVKVYQGN